MSCIWVEEGLGLQNKFNVCYEISLIFHPDFKTDQSGFLPYFQCRYWLKI